MSQPVIIYDRIRNRTKPETKIYVQKNLALVAEVIRLMQQKGWTQKVLAKELGKSESEVSKWLSGLHNFTLKSIAKLEAVLEADLLVVANAHNRETAISAATPYPIAPEKHHTYSVISAVSEAPTFQEDTERI